MQNFLIKFLGKFNWSFVNFMMWVNNIHQHFDESCKWRELNCMICSIGKLISKTRKNFSSSLKRFCESGKSRKNWNKLGIMVCRFANIFPSTSGAQSWNELNNSVESSHQLSLLQIFKLKRWKNESKFELKLLKIQRYFLSERYL